MSPRTATRLQGRVGRHTQEHGRQCQNWAADQQTVIDLLNRISVTNGGPAVRLIKSVVSGKCSDELYHAISSFEDWHFRGQRSGYVDPGGAMLKRMENFAAIMAPTTPNAPAVKPTPSRPPDDPTPRIIFSPKFTRSDNGKLGYDEDGDTIRLPPSSQSAPITSRLKVNGGYDGNDLTTFERQLIDDFKNGKISNYRIMTDERGKIYGYVIEDVDIHEGPPLVGWYGAGSGDNKWHLYRGAFSRKGLLVERQDWFQKNGAAIAESGPIWFIAGGFVGGRIAGFLISRVPRVATAAFAWAAGTNLGEAAYGKTSGVNPVSLLTGDTSVGRPLSAGERVERAVAGAAFAAAAVAAARSPAAVSRLRNTAVDLQNKNPLRTYDVLASPKQFRHSLTADIKPASFAQIEKEGSMRFSTGAEAHYGEGVYAWEAGKQGVGTYSDIQVPAGTGVETIEVEGSRWVRMLPPGGNRLPVKIVGTNLAQDLIAWARKFVASD
jgi:hypothetical protein